ncbi:alpha-tubulin suppressor-like RCC1 family protein [Methanococcus maripaludis]|uniref:Alpha-tubulin suppressor-like RCC1 family protein n=1 Tax=Methanococcus maripaludis TaxID=39152 RepID=A0A7J9NWK9_METMI|nr:hypothetical protein [Methanococcus maripaludis]MBA2851707.1 alpha-tubulin suppressor-like RCC1 family protein [Methanococcus maripaludis]
MTLEYWAESKDNAHVLAPTLNAGENEVYVQVGGSELSDATNVYASFDIDTPYEIADIVDNFVLLTNGDVYCRGYNRYGRLGLGDITDVTHYVKHPLTNVKQIYACPGNIITAFLLENGDVYVCGYDYYNTLGVGVELYTPVKIDTSTLPDSIKKVCVGGQYIQTYTDYNRGIHITILLENGDVYVYGDNQSGQLGLGDNTNRTILTKVTSLSDVDDVYALGGVTLFTLINGDVYTCGTNQCGQLGLGDYTSRNTPTKISITNIADVVVVFTGFICLLTNGDVYTFGGTTSYTHGIDNATVLSPTLVLSSVDKIVGNSMYTLFLSESNGDYVCGKYAYLCDATGIKAQNTPVPITLPLADYTNIYAHDYGVAFVTNNKIELYGYLRLYMYGYQIEPHIAAWDYDESKITRTGFDVFYLDDNGDVYCYGCNSHGQLGLGHNAVVTTWVKNENVSDVKSIAATANHTAFVLNNGDVYICGNNLRGQLGLGDTVDRYTPVKLNLSNVNRCWLNYNCTYILLNDGNVYACGYNNYGQLGVNGGEIQYEIPTLCAVSDVVDINNTSALLCHFIQSNGDVYACGYNYYGQLGLGHNTTPVTTVTKLDLMNVSKIIANLDNSTSYFVLNNGDIYACGSNNACQTGLGEGSANPMLIPTQLSINYNEVEDFKAETTNTLTYKSNDTIYVCGNNYYGQFGTGDTEIVTNPTPITLSGAIKILTYTFGSFVLDSNGDVYSSGDNSGIYRFTLLPDNIKYTTFTKVDIPYNVVDMFFSAGTTNTTYSTLVLVGENGEHIFTRIADYTTGIVNKNITPINTGCDTIPIVLPYESDTNILDFAFETGELYYEPKVTNEPVVTGIEVIDENTLKFTIYSEDELTNYPVELNVSKLGLADNTTNLYVTTTLEDIPEGEEFVPYVPCASNKVYINSTGSVYTILDIGANATKEIYLVKSSNAQSDDTILTNAVGTLSNNWSASNANIKIGPYGRGVNVISGYIERTLTCDGKIVDVVVEVNEATTIAVVGNIKLKQENSDLTVYNGDSLYATISDVFLTSERKRITLDFTGNLQVYVDNELKLSADDTFTELTTIQLYGDCLFTHLKVYSKQTCTVSFIEKNHQ